ncbi:NADH dehydrogenase [ubiquinone] 1 alpha subcomplex subunit 2-like [Homarus americanus]|uniref:NADH dehydrogenase [ubiquinone] 1 alpha subcomplex subunit 2 n=1 Tax=Homarus americanus TaxID=6706 RepID=A0A8J5TTQ2_HOMAM|nr:NADH dehydrogenase [ubiquinone] 1 alpha subcomplex subunit 2-like [Homarus americanus]KAG7176927.1 NADH dehydrogenase [ubiquinone] 1 alpha subcomplex subunit 2-like [Homarus americanus]
MAVAGVLKFAPHLRELRLHLCQRSAASQGVRDFIEQNYVAMKKANPKFPILIRECSGIQPKAWARFEMGRESSASLDGLTAEQVAETIKKLNASK